MSSGCRLSIIVPCYNEAKTIPTLLKRFGEVITEDAEVVVVDNGSIDNTKEVLSMLLPQYPFASVVTVEKNIGYGFGILSGLRAGKGVFLGWTHADMQTDPKDVLTAYERIKKEENPETCFVKGSRKKRPLMDVFFTQGMGVFASLSLGAWMTDINAQPNLFHSKQMDKFKNPPNDFSFDLYAYYMAKRNGLKIIRFPVDFSKRAYGSSHWNTGIASKWKFIKRTANFTIRLRKDLRTQGI
jgi:glycosyltransferase involved in cell wall biosynthesis